LIDDARGELDCHDFDTAQTSLASLLETDGDTLREALLSYNQSRFEDSRRLARICRVRSLCGVIERMFAEQHAND